MARRIGSVVAALAASFLLALIPGTSAAQGVAAPTLEQWQHNARLIATIQNRAAVEAEIHRKWAILTEDGGAELASALARVSIPRLLRAQDAESAEQLDGAIYAGKATGGTLDVPAALGDAGSDLVFFPVTPCRIVNTRVTGTPLVAGAIRAFDTQGPFTAQGGSDTNCGLPSDDVAALAVTVTVVAPQGAGNLRAWPHMADVPTASVINYANYAGLNLANTTVVPLLQSTLFTPEFNVRADVSGTDLIVDVVGYYWSPEQTALDQLVLISGNQFAAHALVELHSPTCPAGTRAISGGYLAGSLEGSITGSRPTAGATYALVTGTNVADTWLIQGFNGPSAQNIWAFVVCGAVPGR